MQDEERESQRRLSLQEERELVSISLGRIWVSTGLGRMQVSIGLQGGRGSHRQPGAPGCEQTQTQTQT